MADTTPFDLEPPDPTDVRPAPASRPQPHQGPPAAANRPDSSSDPTPMDPYIEPDPEPRRNIPVGIPVEPVSAGSSARKADDHDPSTYSVSDLDVCPSCGAPMRGADALVCTRCGFDLKTMKKVRTTTGVVEVAPASDTSGRRRNGVEFADADVDENLPVLSKPGRGDQWLPLGLAGVCGLVLAIAYLAGFPGLFPGREAADITFGLRSAGFLRFLILTAMWTGCGMAGLAVLAHLMGMRIGDWPLAAMRMLAIAAVMQVIRLLGFSIVWLEHAAEIILQLGAFAGLALVLFNIKPKDLPMLVGSAVALFLALWMGSAAVVWATTGS